MSMYSVEWTEEVWNSIVIEADTADAARELFLQGQFDGEKVKVYSTNRQDNVEIYKFYESKDV